MGAAAEVFRLVGKFVFDNAEGNQGIEETTNKAKSFSEKLAGGFKTVGVAAENMGKKLLPVTTTLGGIGVVSGKMALDFKDSIADINTLLDDDSHLDGYERAVKSTSRETGLSIENMARGMYQAISSLGDGGEETEKIFSTMAKSAKAGGAEVSDSVSLISAGMKGYNSINDETAKRISDLAFQTAKLGVTTFPEMAKSMQPLFPLSNSLNLSYEDLFGSMATLTGVTGNTAEVSTQLKAVFSNLMKPTTAMGELISQYGYSSAQAMLKSEGFAGILKIVQAETGGQADKMAELFSSTEAVTAMTALTGAQFDAFNYKLSEMGNATGATQTAYEKLNTSGDKLRKAWNNLKITGLDLGITLIDTLAPIIEKVSEKVSKFSDWFSALDGETKKVIITVGAFIVAAGPVLIFLGKVSSGIGSIIQVGGALIGGIGKVSGAVTSIISIGGKLAGGIVGLVGKIGGVLIPAIGSISGPVLAVIAVLGALVAAGVAVYKNWDEIQEWGQKAWAAVKEAVGNAVDGIVGFFVGLGEKAGEMKDAVVGKVTELKDGAVQKFTELKDNAIEKAAELKDRVVDKYHELKEGASAKVAELKERAVEKFSELKEKASAKVSELKERAVSEITSMKERASSQFQELKDRAVEKVNTLKENAVSKFTELKDRAAEKIQSLKERSVAGFEELRAKGLEKFDRLKSGVTEKLEAVKNFVSNTVQKLKGFFNFDWSLPKIKLPHFSMEGSFSLDPPSIPHIGVEWYKKAMDSPVLMEKPTAFGINPAGQIMAGGEAGSEVVSGTETLMGMISAAVAENNSQLYGVLDRIYSLLAQHLPSLAGLQVVLDTGALVGEMAGQMDEELGQIAHMRGRWN
ncbi:hypothetical protein IMSAGC019_03131 [Lachnospiraceae bacterium]|nr:hypothetical protein IMSAGC019_03131 [Lachnospiraceae bacterium]